MYDKIRKLEIYDGKEIYRLLLFNVESRNIAYLILLITTFLS